LTTPGHFTIAFVQKDWPDFSAGYFKTGPDNPATPEND
jgi:hypothetical protein